MAASPAVGLAPSPGSQTGSVSGQPRSIGELVFFDEFPVMSCMHSYDENLIKLF